MIRGRWLVGKGGRMGGKTVASGVVRKIGRMEDGRRESSGL